MAQLAEVDVIDGETGKWVGTLIPDGYGYVFRNETDEEWENTAQRYLRRGKCDKETALRAIEVALRHRKAGTRGKLPVRTMRDLRQHWFHTKAHRHVHLATGIVVLPRNDAWVIRLPGGAYVCGPTGEPMHFDTPTDAKAFAEPLTRS